MCWFWNAKITVRRSPLEDTGLAPAAAPSLPPGAAAVPQLVEELPPLTEAGRLGRIRRGSSSAAAACCLAPEGKVLSSGGSIVGCSDCSRAQEYPRLHRAASVYSADLILFSLRLITELEAQSDETGVAGPWPGRAPLPLSLCIVTRYNRTAWEDSWPTTGKKKNGCACCVM
jgi:hypothetical protein